MAMVILVSVMKKPPIGKGFCSIFDNVANPEDSWMDVNWDGLFDVDNDNDGYSCSEDCDDTTYSYLSKDDDEDLMEPHLSLNVKNLRFVKKTILTMMETSMKSSNTMKMEMSFLATSLKTAMVMESLIIYIPTHMNMTKMVI